MTHYVLFSPSFDPILLVPPKSYFLGRAAENEIVLDSHMISRVHARLFWNQDSFVLCDRGSRNGSLLNGVELIPGEFYPLNDKDELRIDPFLMKFRTVEGELELLKKIEMERLKWTHLQEKLEKLEEGEFYEGNLTTYRLSQLLQLLENTKGNGTLEFRDEENALVGFLFWESGQLLNAESGSLHGLEALGELFGLQEGYFRFTADSIQRERGLFYSTPQLMLQFFTKLHPPPNLNPKNTWLEKIFDQLTPAKFRQDSRRIEKVFFTKEK